MTSGAAPFIERHIGTSHADRQTMLEALGYARVEQLLDAAVPDSIRMPAAGLSDLSTVPLAVGEREALSELRTIAAKNTLRRSMIGLGYHGTETPAVITRNVLENPSWYTAYTPYQPEISQGRLEALITFQTMVTDLTGLNVANSSMLDEGTAAVEAMLLARRASKSASNVFLIDTDALPQTKALLAHRAEAVGVALAEVDFGASASSHRESLPDAFGLLIQYPGASGRVWDPRAITAEARERGIFVTMAADLLALAILAPPGELGADVAVGTTQRFGVPLGFGGPHAGYLAVRSGLERQLPGRLVGVSKDASGAPAYRLTLQTREQHIRREKATSNICTAQVLLAVMAAMYAVYHGPQGIRRIAQQVHARTGILARALRRAGVEVLSEHFFDTVLVCVADADATLERAREGGILLRRVDQATVALTVDEVTAADEGIVPELLDVFTPDAREAQDATPGPAIFDAGSGAAEFAPLAFRAFPGSLARASDYLTHPVFNTHHSETAMMRYLRRLADKDYALDRGMIPLGSCTMKLNAATEMAAVTWPEFADIHPFAPAEDVAGYVELIGQLEGWLAELTGYDTVSLQPNAGSQGELAGLLAIRAYHRSRGDEQRTVCLIPQSAHGTNAASAVLAGMTVVVVACDEHGNVDLDDLTAKIADARARLAALMITYPSTHGVYEHEVRAICDAVHAAGGQVYLDGANLNALLGYARFGDFGGDVSHLNLHKTFCIPHGGGGPGVGPVAAKKHLAPFLPTVSANPVSAAPYGSAGILPITWAYIRMMGESGLKAATESAVLAANYIAARLRDHFPVLYAGEHGLVAHECVLDLRPLTAATGVTVDDVAKRLIDYGFHAPTMSFPVPGTLMVEPTESEDLAELDRFIEAMVAIKAEADAVGAGHWPTDDSPLRNAPHTAESIAASEWSHPYSREEAVYPVPALRNGKYWPPVRRIDQAYGDRNLFCSCPPVESFG